MGEHRLVPPIKVRVNAQPASVEAGCDATFSASVQWVEVDEEGSLVAVRTPLRKIPADRLVEITPELATAVTMLRHAI